MEYREIVAVTGLGGLYQLLATKSDGAIVRNLADKSTKFISARLHNVTPLESIEIYTTGENVRLHEVFQKMKEEESNNAPIDTKKASSKDIKAYFDTVYPGLDEDRVYASDMKKMLKWYQLLKENDLLKFEAQEPQPEAEETNDEPKKKAESDKETEEKPVKKSRTKKAAEPAEESEEKPTKKTAKKKKTEE